MVQKPLSIESLYKHALTLQDLPNAAAKDKKAAPSQSKKYEMACDLEIKLQKEIDRRTDCMRESQRDLSVQAIQTVLCSIKPTIITPFNLASMAGKTATVSKKRLCELLTYTTGMKGSHCSQPFYHAFATLKDLSSHLIRLNESRGDMAALICWPLNWDRDGVYRCNPKLAYGVVEATSIFAKRTVQIKLTDHNFAPTLNWEDFVLRENYCVKEATLQQKGSVAACELQEYFRESPSRPVLADA
eukprot:1270473-Amphidinium_carterae.1